MLKDLLGHLCSVQGAGMVAVLDVRWAVVVFQFRVAELNERDGLVSLEVSLSQTLYRPATPAASSSAIPRERHAPRALGFG